MSFSTRKKWRNFNHKKEFMIRMVINEDDMANFLVIKDVHRKLSSYYIDEDEDDYFYFIMFYFIILCYIISYNCTEVSNNYRTTITES